MVNQKCPELLCILLLSLNQGLIYIYLAAVLESGTHLYLNLIIISECVYLISTLL